MTASFEHPPRAATPRGSGYWPGLRYDTDFFAARSTSSGVSRTVVRTSTIPEPPTVMGDGRDRLVVRSVDDRDDVIAAEREVERVDRPADALGQFLDRCTPV